MVAASEALRCLLGLTKLLSLLVVFTVAAPLTLVFDANSRLAVVRDEAGLLFPATLTACGPTTVLREISLAAGGLVALAQASGPAPAGSAVNYRSIEQLESFARAGGLAPALAALLPALEPHLVAVPYLHLGENDFIYKFRPAQERNPAIYAQDAASGELYQSSLCAAIKARARRHERTAAEPVELDFGDLRYVLPSHFGFCLGVKNAIERAYETLAAHPGRRVFMLSELIHNPFVNADLLRRGLRYLQSDKGAPLTLAGRPPTGAPGERLAWDDLTDADIVIIPAFGATDDDKRRLVRKGIPVCAHDATCMLVEKVWKAARAYGRDGYTVIIHGKHEHEETKATFANTRRYAPAVIVRDLAETRRLGALAALAQQDPLAAQATFAAEFGARATPGLNVARDLARVAVVNQTTLLMNETRAIIDWLRGHYAALFGPDAAATPPRIGGAGRSDTLCYATQVNQDALGRALDATALDAAFVIGGVNSSNTYQLHRVCAQRLGVMAFFIQSEANILSLDTVEHYVFPAAGTGQGGHIERRALWPGESVRPRRILITGGASCPDGLVDHVIARLNTLFATAGARLRAPAEVLAGLGPTGVAQP
jgi:4-hydroxy-3-methylbut-2-en-1-yl diphosphate reductase